MTTGAPSFGGDIPRMYDRGLGPLFFEPYARDLARRLDLRASAAVLEIAAGTGIATEQLLARIGQDARLVATDVNDAMLAIAREKVPDDRRVEWRTADALALPFGDGTFDAVVCQFGFMFFPDKAAASREMKRVLKGGGQLLLSTWGSLADNPVAGLAFEVIASFYHTNPPRFLETPFGSYDPQPILAWLTAAGFSDVEYEVVDIEGHSESAELAAQGIVLGTPNINQISERGGVDPTVIVHAVAARLASEGGAVPMRLPMRALVFSAKA